MMYNDLEWLCIPCTAIPKATSTRSVEIYVDMVGFLQTLFQASGMAAVVSFCPETIKLKLFTEIQRIHIHMQYMYRI